MTSEINDSIDIWSSIEFLGGQDTEVQGLPLYSEPGNIEDRCLPYSSSPLRSWEDCGVTINPSEIGIYGDSSLPNIFETNLEHLFSEPTPEWTFQQSERQYLETVCLETSFGKLPALDLGSISNNSLLERLNTTAHWLQTSSEPTELGTQTAAVLEKSIVNDAATVEHAKKRKD